MPTSLSWQRGRHRLYVHGNTPAGFLDRHPHADECLEIVGADETGLRLLPGFDEAILAAEFYRVTGLHVASGDVFDFRQIESCGLFIVSHAAWPLVTNYKLWVYDCSEPPEYPVTTVAG